MNVTDYMVQQATDFNRRVDDTQKLLSDLDERIGKLEYNIERLEHNIQVLTDTLPLALPKHQKDLFTLFITILDRKEQRILSMTYKRYLHISFSLRVSVLE